MLLHLNSEFVRLGCDRSGSEHVYSACCVSSSALCWIFPGVILWALARAGSKVQWSDFHAGLSKGDGAAGAAFLPRQVSGHFILLDDLILRLIPGYPAAQKGCPGGKGTFQSCTRTFRRSLHLSIVCEGLCSCCCSVGWLGLAVHSWVWGKCMSLGETFHAITEMRMLVFWHRRAENWCWCGLVSYWGFVGTLSLGAGLFCCNSCCPPHGAHLTLMFFHLWYKQNKKKIHNMLKIHSSWSPCLLIPSSIGKYLHIHKKSINLHAMPHSGPCLL